MLRRRPDDTFEYRHVEMALRAFRPAPLAADRREALRRRIMMNLGVQEQPRQRLVIRERWVTVPAGIGVAAAIIAALQFAPRPGDEPADVIVAQALGDVLIDGQPGDQARPGQAITALSFAWIGITGDLRLGLEPGARVAFVESSAGVVIAHQAGDVTFVAGASGVRADGDNWSANVAANSVLKVAMTRGVTVLTVEEGSALIVALGRSFTLTPGSGPLVIPATDPGPQPLLGSEPGSPAAAANGESAPGAATPDGGAEALPGNSGGAPGQADPPGNGGNAPGQADPPGNSGNAPGQADPPGNSGNAPGQADPPGNKGNAPGQADPPGNSGNAPGQADPPGNSGGVASGQSNPPGNSGNAPGQADPPRNNGGVASGQSNPPGNGGNPHGTGRPPASSGSAEPGGGASAAGGPVTGVDEGPVTGVGPAGRPGQAAKKSELADSEPAVASGQVKKVKGRTV
ncbi:MAG: hypothetical protein C0506_05555 [Anaerolinea sp.]|nr:hypothetical protein [Anaerolinea sp.]